MSIELTDEVRMLVATVQHNCHITDARHARSMTLCSYLLEMREYFRWEQGLAPSAAPPRAALSRWIAERETLWNDLEESEFAPLNFAGEQLDPFASDAVNELLREQGLVYGAGIGRFHRPHFFLGERVQQEVRDGVSVLVSGREYARDLTAVPAAMRSGTIYLRQDVVRRWLWEKIEAWEGQPKNGPLRRALLQHGFDADADAAILRMAEIEGEALILHELGEHRAGRWLGSAWEEMLAGFSERRAEILCRAVRDLIADCEHTLPTLLARGAQASLHFWFANLDGMRRALFPGLAVAYAQWYEHGDDTALQQTLAEGSAHWREVATRLLDIHHQEGAAGEAQISALADADRLAL